VLLSLLSEAPLKRNGFWLALCAAIAACGSSNPPAACVNACQKILGCSGGAGYGYGFGYSGTAYSGSFGYGVYGYAPGLTLSECTSGCQALAAADQNRIVSCVTSNSTCSAELSCE
jgi:hypothetical protein